MRWLRQHRRHQAKAQGRRIRLRLALFARQEIFIAIDEAVDVDVVEHLIAALDALDSAIGLLGAQVYPHLADEVTARRSVVPDRVPIEWSA